MEFDIVLLLLFFYVLGKSSEWVTDSLVGLGVRLKINKFLMGFVVLGLATTAPEFLVAINAIAMKVPVLSLGNILGASFVLLTLIAGLSLLLSKQINIFRAVSVKELMALNVIILLPAALILDGMLSRTDGIILIAAYVAYIIYIITKKNMLGNATMGLLNGKGKSSGELIGFLILGLIVMTMAAKYAVDIGTEIAFGFGIPPLVVGLILFSIGTNLPELTIAFEAKASYKKYILFGDLLGSSAANSLIIGLVAFFQPIQALDMSFIYLMAAFLAGGVLAFNIAALTQRKLVKEEGFLLIGVYILFIVSVVLLNLL
jgi:cation:H+ antiporter